MEGRNRTILMVLIGVVIVLAIFSSFGLNLFGSTEEVRFPAPAPSHTGSGPNIGGQPTGPEQLVRIEVTQDTVQSMIGTLSRPENYYRVVTVSTYRSDGREDSQSSRVWVSGGWTRTETELSSGQVRYTIVGDGAVYRWYSGDREARSWPADGASADIEGQRILTYEDVLALAPESITDAGYELRSGVNCIYVEVENPSVEDRRERYWISVEDGLLVEAEMTEGEQVFYRMTTGAVERSAEISLRLPDGTQLPVSPDPAEAEAPA